MIKPFSGMIDLITYAVAKAYVNKKVQQLQAEFGGAFRYQADVNYYDLLPTTGLEAGYVYTVVYAGTSQQGGTDEIDEEYAWSINNTWVKIGPDMSTFIRMVEQTLTNAQKLQARTNIGVSLSTNAGIVDGDTGLVSGDQVYTHVDTKIASQNGVHGLRYYNGALQYDNNGTWTTISISGQTI